MPKKAVVSPVGIVVGIDPGITGAVCVLCDDAVEFHDTPTLTIKSGKSVKHVIDVHAAALLLEKIRPSYICIEKVGAMPNAGQSMGATSAFNFGMGYGMWLGIIAALKIPFDQVHPAAWKKLMMVGMSKEKDASRQRAMQLYPHVAKDLNLKKHHGRADALLIANFGQLQRSVHPK